MPLPDAQPVRPEPAIGNQGAEDRVNLEKSMPGYDPASHAVSSGRPRAGQARDEVAPEDEARFQGRSATALEEGPQDEPEKEGP
jgi:hypothetical protein